MGSCLEVCDCVWSGLEPFHQPVQAGFIVHFREVAEIRGEPSLARQETAVTFSHGIGNDCLRRLYPALAEDIIADFNLDKAADSDTDDSPVPAPKA